MSKIIYTEKVAGVELEVSKIREGTRCKCCGKVLFGTMGRDYYRTHTKSCSVAYVCNDCIEHKLYGSDLQNRAIIGGKLTAGKYRFAIELEADYIDYSKRKEVDLYLAAQWGLQPSNDCTVDVEYHMTNKVNFHGLKDFMEDIGNTVNLDSPNCGHHINISKIEWTAEDMDEIRENGHELFGNLQRTMVDNREGTISLFGRYFSGWARNDSYFEHGSWVNLNNTYHIEFRLPHYVNAQQFFYCACFCREIIDILDEWLEKRDTQKTSAKMTKAFTKYINGKATCQRPERNSVDRT